MGYRLWTPDDLYSMKKNTIKADAGSDQRNSFGCLTLTHFYMSLLHSLTSMQSHYYVSPITERWGHV